MDDILIIGSSGHAKVAIDAIEKQGRYKIFGLIDDFRKVGETTLDREVVGGLNDLAAIVHRQPIGGVFVAVGDNSLRAKVSQVIAKAMPKVEFVTIIHPSAVIGKDCIVGKGSILMAGAVVNPSCRVGDFCIVNTNASLDHDSVMEDFSSLAPNVATGGNCVIGNYSAIGIGSSLFHKVRIGEHTVVGAGSVVSRDLPSFSVCYGVPAKKVRDRKLGERYL